MKRKRAPGLIAIVVYKAFVAVLLAVTAIALLLALKNYPAIAEYSDSYVLEGKHLIIGWVLDKILSLDPKTLKYSGIAAGVYALVTTVEAVGLWYEKTWAKILVLVLVGASIPAEVFELIHGLTLLKVVVFFANIAVFWYLLGHVRSEKKRAR